MGNNGFVPKLLALRPIIVIIIEYNTSRFRCHFTDGVRRVVNNLIAHFYDVKDIVLRERNTIETA